MKMGTRTAVFQEQANGGFKGIYVQFDGYIKGAGKILHRYYQNRRKTAELINQHEGLDGLGIEPKIIPHPLSAEEYEANCNEAGLPIYSRGGRGTDEFFGAPSLEMIRTLDYYRYNGKGELKGFYQSGMFVPYTSSDNNGYVYVQMKDGEWLVSTRTVDYEMSEFELLAKYFIGQEACISNIMQHV